MITEKKIYFLHKDGYESGPFSLGKLKQMHQEKIITDTDLVWTEGMPEWTPFNEILRQRRATNLIQRNPKHTEHHYTPNYDAPNSPKVSYKPVILLGTPILILAFYLMAPFIALYDLKRALESGDIESLQERIDFPEIRQSIKEQMKASFMQGLTNNGESNALAAGIALAFGPAIIDGIIDSVVTPSGISNLIWNAKFPAPRKDGQPLDVTDTKTEERHFNFSYAGFSSPTAFKVISKDKNLVLRFHLKDFRWKLYDIELPK